MPLNSPPNFCLFSGLQPTLGGHFLFCFNLVACTWHSEVHATKFKLTDELRRLFSLFSIIAARTEIDLFIGYLYIKVKYLYLGKCSVHAPCHGMHTCVIGDMLIERHCLLATTLCQLPSLCFLLPTVTVLRRQCKVYKCFVEWVVKAGNLTCLHFAISRILFVQINSYTVHKYGCTCIWVFVHVYEFHTCILYLYLNEISKCMNSFAHVSHISCERDFLADIWRELFGSLPFHWEHSLQYNYRWFFCLFLFIF